MLACLVGSDGPSDCQVEISVLFPREGCWRVLSLQCCYGTLKSITLKCITVELELAADQKRDQIFSVRELPLILRMYSLADQPVPLLFSHKSERI